MLSIHNSWIVNSFRTYPEKGSLFWSCYHTLELILTQLPAFKEIQFFVRVWLLRCTNVEAFGWCVSVRFHKEPPTFDIHVLLGYTTPRCSLDTITLQLPPHLFQADFFCALYWKFDAINWPFFFFFKHRWLFHLRNRICSSLAEILSFSKSSPFLTVILFSDGYFLHG